MKKFMAMLLAVIMVFSLMACGAKDPASNPGAENKPAEGNQDAPTIATKTQEELEQEASAEKDYSGRKLSLMMSIDFSSLGLSSVRQTMSAS